MERPKRDLLRRLTPAVAIVQASLANRTIARVLLLIEEILTSSRCCGT
ncbi:MAG TPA: hypothetical protein VLJ18_03525 [Thermoanaerobaculia bacterium]|nr:hypothetical protein [Thermoanaerobaculia bacterium]